MDVLLLLWQPSPKQGIVLGLHGCWVSHMTFPSFVMWWVTLSFQISNQPWISGISPTWLKCSLLFIYYWIQFDSSSLRTFISVFMRKTIYYIPTLLLLFSGFWYQIYTGFIKWIGNCFKQLYILKEFACSWYYLSVILSIIRYYLKEKLVTVIALSGVFLVGKFWVQFNFWNN